MNCSQCGDPIVGPDNEDAHDNRDKCIRSLQAQLASHVRYKALLGKWIAAAQSGENFGRMSQEPTPARLREAIASATDYMNRVQAAELRAGLLETALRTLVDAHDPGETAIMREVQAIAEMSSYSVHAHANGARQAFDWVRNRIKPALDLARTVLADQDGASSSVSPPKSERQP